MSLYSYIAQDAANNIKRGSLEGANRQSVAEQLMRTGLRPLEIHRTLEGRGGSLFKSLQRERVRRADVDYFTKQVALLLGAGLSLDGALRTIKLHSHNGAFREFVSAIERRIKEGKSFSEALAEHPQHFSPMYVNIVKAGEEGGILPAMLVRISEYQASFNELKQFIISAAIYPAFLLLVGLVAMIVLVVFIMPRFELLFAGMGHALPFQVQVLINGAKLLSSHLLLVGAILVAVPLALVQYLKSAAGKETVDRLAIRLPVVSGFVRDLETTRIFRTLEVLVNNGVHLAIALRISSGVAGNREFQRLLQHATSALKEGQRVGPKLKGSRLLPDMAGDLLSVGEESGRVGQVCGQIADHYEEGLRLKTKRLIALIEPLFILTIALVAGYVVISMLSVILSVNDIAG